tara:strand:- start:46164 stop:46388 length:225 start_codon:yes stop_codon:yes gene_type:complete
MEIAVIIVLVAACIWFNIRYAMIHEELIRTRGELTFTIRKKKSDYDSYRTHMVKMAEKVDRFASAFEEWNSKKS